MSQNQIPIDVAHLLPALDKKLIELLKSLTPEEWAMQTIAKKWKVKDVAAHLLDGNIRILSTLRDNYFGEKTEAKTYGELVDFLNRLNADWVCAMKRVSPDMLIALLEFTGPMYCNYYQSLDPSGKAGFAVDWAGEAESKNWMHIAREYTEKWLHQQQIRDAVKKTGLMTKDFFRPFINIFMLALPHTYRNVNASDGTSVNVTIDGSIGGSWILRCQNNRWQFADSPGEKFEAEIILDPDTAWKLFSKSWRPIDVREKVKIIGNKELGEVALTMVSVMA
ncbi:MAG: maleylpyruvate isomerase N-terminal domain-containing protein [Bacteroidetes bacterium]|nr:maleylpyruvate isomerase N-terminal domain-containing protein [Bacteroidota bacterium]